MTEKIVSVFGGAHCLPEKESLYFTLAYETGKLLAQAGFTVATGAGSGLMDEVLHGAKEAGGKTIGVGLGWSGTQSKHAMQIEVHDTLSPRQDKLIQLGDAYLALPGGIGTFYEIYNVIVLKRIQEMSLRKPLILISDYFKPQEKVLRDMVQEGFVREEVFTFFSIVQTPLEATEKLCVLISDNMQVR